MKRLFVLFLALLAVIGVSYGGDRLVAEYHQPALSWDQEAIPIGNGSLGGMIFGGVEFERVQFNHDTLWTGDDKNRGDYQAFGDVLVNLTDGPVLIPEYLDKRRLLFRNNYEDTIDGNPETTWGERFDINGDPVIWEAEFSEKILLPSYSMTSREGAKGRGMPQAWEFQGSNDGKDWTTLDEQKGDFWSKSAQTKIFKLNNKKPYDQYRFLFRATKKPSPENLKRKWHPETFSIGEIDLGDYPAVQYGNYRRGLNIEDATSFVSYEVDGVKYKREYFCSNPAGVLVIRLTADQPGKYAGAVMLKDAHGAGSKADGQRITFGGALDNGEKYEAQLHVLNDGGKLKVSDDKLVFSDADSLTLYLVAGTDYLPDIAKNWKGEDPHEKLTEQLDRAVSRDYARILVEHVKDYKSLFDRVKFDITGAKRGNKPFDERLEAYTEGGEDIYLERFLFHMGRYLLISSSRPGCLPANLQGLWNNRLAPTWGSDYHSNINIQMSYWPAQTANMQELHMQYINYILSQIPGYRMRLKEAVEKGDKNMKGEPRWKKLPRGWTMRTNGNIYGATGYRWCETANAWHMQHFWEQYAFTQDKEYLEKIAYPAMKEVCEYWEDRLKKREDGTLVVPDGWSPEHGEEEDGVTYDQMFVWDLFNNFVEASDELAIDKEYRDKIADMRDHLLAPKIGSWGQLQEWEEDKDDKNDTHRHFSHMVGLHPGRQITPGTTPKLAEACKVTLKAKEKAMEAHPKYPDFWKMTGWSKVWRIAMWARLYEPERAYNMVNEFIRYRVYENMMSTCPPICLDASWGYTSGIVEMLLQSHVRQGTEDRGQKTGGLHPFELHILPALTKKWATGSVKGLTARGAFEVDIDWADMKATQITIKSKAGKMCRVRTGEKMTDISGIDEGKVKRPEKNVIEFPTEVGGVYTLKP